MTDYAYYVILTPLALKTLVFTF